MNKQETIDYILNNFDFSTVHKVMTYLDWKWYAGGVRVPTEDEVYTCAEDLLEGAYDKPPYRIATGGLSVRSELDSATGKVYLELVFELTGWDNYE